MLSVLITEPFFCQRIHLATSGFISPFGGLNHYHINHYHINHQPLTITTLPITTLTINH